MLLYLLFLVGIIIIYRSYKEGYGNPFGEMDSTCLLVTDSKGPIKYIVNGSAFYTSENDFVNYGYNSILKKADINTYLSQNNPEYCRI
jgi:hypothetical protein